MRIVFRSTRRSRDSQVLAGITGFRFSTWNQSSTSTDMAAAGGVPGLGMTVMSDEPMATLPELGDVLALREGEIRGFAHVDRDAR